MCGFAAIFGLESLGGPEGARPRVEAMLAAMAHRGPDGSGVQSVGAMAVLGHRRLSIIDRSDAAAQPFCDPLSGDCLVFTGEVYNYLELRAELEADWVFRSASDTEVVLAALRKWGTDALHRFNGMWGFAWWQEATRTLWVVRDRFGEKPVVWAEAGSAVVVASEVRAVLASGLVERRLDSAGVADFLRYGTVHAPGTLVAGVQVLAPGHLLRITDAGVEELGWWDTARAVRDHAAPADVAELHHRIRTVFSDAVRLRTRADVPVGAFLSGGIDSAAVVGAMAAVGPVSTFTVALDGQPMDEAAAAAATARHFGTDHHELRLDAEAVREGVPQAVAALDRITGDGLNTYAVAGAARRAGITVALSGLGGDELFAGYPVFLRSHVLLQRRWIGSFPKGLRGMVGDLYSAWRPEPSARKQAEVLAGDYFDLEHTYPVSRAMFLEREVRRLFPAASRRPNRVHSWLLEALHPSGPGFALPFLSKVSLAELRTYCSDVLLADADAVGLAQGLEIRAPFLDVRLVTEALAAPDTATWPVPPKRLLVAALGDGLPPGVAGRPKQGFRLPLSDWMRGPLNDYCAAGIAAAAGLPGLSRTHVELVWTTFLGGSPRWNAERVWLLVVLGHYTERHGLR
jgi:asparagine synthase (glutamine-hydrolysing)